MLPPMNADPAEPKRAGRGGRAARRRGSDRFAVLNGFVDCTMSGLSRGPLAVWLVLYRDTRDGTARTSIEDIARRAGLSKRRAVEAVGKLCKVGLLTRVYRGGLNRGPSVYRVHPRPREPSGSGDAGDAGTGDVSGRGLVTRASSIPEGTRSGRALNAPPAEPRHGASLKKRLDPTPAIWLQLSPCGQVSAR